MFPLGKLHTLFAEVCDNGVVVALSGGVDSILLLSCLAEYRDQHPYPLKAVTIHAPMTVPFDIHDARTFAESLDMPWQLVKADPLTVAAVKKNKPNRCYYCKKFLFTEIEKVAKKEKIKTVMDGTNASDSPKERPGMKALHELEILSPFARCGITKEMIRAEAIRRNLPVANKPANACYATRFPPNTELTATMLAKIAVAEVAIMNDLPKNTAFRLRCWGDIGVLEIDPKYFALFDLYYSKWLSLLSPFGFRELLLHPDGLQSGRMTPPPALKDYQ